MSEKKPLTLVIQPRGKPIHNLPREITFPGPTATAADIYNTIATQSAFSIHRLRITKGSDGSAIPNSSSVPLEATGLRDRSSIAVKDLGPQIAWRTVFFIEYLGPLLIHPLVYFARPYIYANQAGKHAPFPEPSEMQTLALWMVTLHFLKREIETLFVHRFSLATMPAFNIFKNSAHYWFLSGINLAYWVYAPTSPTNNVAPWSPLVKAAVGAFVVGELGNLYTHLVLRNLRPEGSTKRAIPTGFGFGLVTCPNYMFECLAWLSVCVVTWSWASVLFWVVATAQMGVWAKKKERRYRKEFPGTYKKKSAGTIPFVW